MFNKDPDIPNHRLSRVRSQCFYRKSIDLDRGARFRVHLEILKKGRAIGGPARSYFI